jgi:hypothetical protein
MRRILSWVAVMVCGLAAAIGALALWFAHSFYPSPPRMPSPRTPEAQQQDFDYFRSYFELNRTWSPAALAEAKRLLEEERAQAGRLSPAQFDLAIARMAALADNGHSRVHPGPLSRRHNRLPCRFYRFADGYFILRARGRCEELLGAKVVRIDGHSIDEMEEQLYRYFGGPRSHFDQFASVFFLESPELLQAAGLIQSADRVTLHLLLRDGAQREVELNADPPDPRAPGLYGVEYLSPQRVEGETADWHSLLPSGAPLPVFLRDFNQPFRSEFWPERATYYAAFRSNEDEPGHPIADFVSKIRSELRADAPRIIVLDLRFDQGGNFTTTASLMKDLVRIAPSVKHVYVLTSAWTFSAGIVSLALLKEHGGGQVTIVGEPVGDRLRLWAEGGTMVLPNSQLRIGFATGLHDYQRSCWGQPGCFWVMYFYPMHLKSLAPEVAIAYAFSDYLGLRDPLLDGALAAAANRTDAP